MMAVPDRQVSESALCLTGLTYIDQPPFQPDTVQHGPTNQRARSPTGHERSPETVGERGTPPPPVSGGLLVGSEL
jgi:hypothetical protein